MESFFFDKRVCLGYSDSLFWGCRILMGLEFENTEKSNFLTVNLSESMSLQLYQFPKHQLTFVLVNTNLDHEDMITVLASKIVGLLIQFQVQSLNILCAFPFKTAEGNSDDVHIMKLIESSTLMHIDGVRQMPASTPIKDAFLAAMVNFLIVAEISTSIIAISGQKPHSRNLLKSPEFLKKLSKDAEIVGKILKTNLDLNQLKLILSFEAITNLLLEQWKDSSEISSEISLYV